jgi:hypothetical protein
VCTVSVVPTIRGFRLACNRDEHRLRPLALPPFVRPAGARRSCWPRDPQSGGTWIGVNDMGLAIVLLNRAPTDVVGAVVPTISRGVLIPSLLRLSSIENAMQQILRRLSVTGGTGAFAPFALVMVQRHRTAVLEYRAGKASVTAGRLARPVLVTSSSLGDEIVDRPRRRLFAALMKSSRHALQAQARFHRHYWPDRPHVSVRMSRADAATVSHTIVDVSGTRITLSYTSDPSLEPRTGVQSCSLRFSSARSFRRT